MTAPLFQHYLIGHTLPVASEVGQPSRTHLALDLTTLDPVCLRLGPDPGPHILDFLEAFHHRRGVSLPYCPQASSGGVHDEQSFVVESWIAGAALTTLRAGTARDPRAAMHLAWSLTRALADLHGQYLVHGDLHPDNVLVDRKGQLQLVGDFPSPLQAPDTTLPESSEAGRYAAPEVDAGEPPTRRSDVFSLGLLLFEAFEGHRLLAPHRRGGFPLDPNIQAKIDRAVEDATRLPSPVRLMILQCLRLVADHRPAHAGDVLHHLIQAGEGIPSLEDRRATLRPLARRAMRQVARDWLPEPVVHLDPSRMLEHAARVWRYAQAVSTRDRAALARGYRATVEALWLGLTASGAVLDEQTSAELSVALFWLHRAVHRWKSRTLSFLVEALARRVLDPESPLALVMATRRTPRRTRDRLKTRCLDQLRQSPSSSRPLLTLAILDEELTVPVGVPLAQVKATVLERAGLSDEARHHDSPEEEKFSDPETSSSGSRSGVRLPELLEALGQAHALSRPPPNEDSDPPRPEDELPEELGFDSGVSSGVDLSAASPFQVDLDASDDALPLDQLSSSPDHSARPPSSPGRLSLRNSPPSTSKPTPPSTFSLAEEHAAALFSKGQTLLAEDRLEEATEVFQELVGAGLLQRAHYRAALSAELRRLLWRVVHPKAPKGTRVLVELWELCLQLHLDDLASLCELLLMRRRADAPVEVMARRRSTSPHLLQACIRRAGLRQAHEDVARFLVSLAQLHLDVGELAGALRHLQRVPREDRDAAHAQAWKRMFQVAELVADAAAEFRRLLAELAETRYAEYTAQRLAAFLDEYPFFAPARLRLVEHGLENDLPLRTGQEGVIQAEVHLLRNDPEHARRLLRRVLELEPENDEAMLLLATLAPDVADVPQDRALLRPHLLARADAVRAAHHQAMRGLAGTPEDVPLRELLIQLCQRLGESPAPHRLALGLAALESGDPDRARNLCTAAVAESLDRPALLAQLEAHPKVGEIFTAGDLERLARPAETVQA